MSDDESHQDEMLDRERQAEKALNEALAKGVSIEALRVLARETGCVRWALEQSISLKG